MYHAPLKDIQFALNNIAEYHKIAELSGNEDATPDVVQPILEEAAKFAANLLAPINHQADLQGSTLGNGEVQTPDGFRDAYQQFIEAGWMTLAFPQEYGGQAFPWILSAIVQEMWDGANMSWGLCSILSRGAIELLLTHAPEEQKSIYLSKLISGEWSGTMNLTEAHAGSDLGSIKCMATPNEDHYLLKGQKIFITWGEQDFTENIIHLVLARTPDAPAGPRGVSLFLVPKFLVDEDGNPGERNDLQCVALEKKLGIRGSATCVMSYGEEEGAVGYLIGDVGKGIATMFTMMNNERLAVSLQSIAVADRAYQLAREFAKERVQSRSAVRGDGPGAVTIIHHADVRRMLLSMKSRIEAGRAICYYAMAQIDFSNSHSTEAVREAAHKRVDLLTPIVKNWCTESATDVANLGIQVHGGAGFIEETGAAQHLRDSRICSIYEGTSGIQANDLVVRKVLMDDGEQISLLVEEIKSDISTWQQQDGLKDLARFDTSLERLQSSVRSLEQAVGWILDNGRKNANSALASAYHFSMMCGYVISCWLMARGVMNAIASTDNPVPVDELNARAIAVKFLTEQYLHLSDALLHIIQSGDQTIMALSEDQF
jgi:alkylation response protein AidB-like acyl-CoA dehydrogenase